MRTKFVFAQTFKVQDKSGEGGALKVSHQNTSLAMYSLEDTATQLIQPQHMPKGQQSPTHKEFGFKISNEAIQWVGFIQDP